MTIKIDKGPLLGMRHVQGLLLFLHIAVIYISRMNIGVAIVAMTNAETTNPNFPEFDWNERQISYIISSVFWGDVLTQFLGGVLCRRFGTKLTMGVSTFVNTILTASTPWLVTWGGWQAYCVLRFVQGMFQGVLIPGVYQHLAKWVPVEERNRICAISLTGIDIGVVMAMILSGLIAHGPMGWPGISYVSAGLCGVWCVLWLILGADNENSSRFIGDTEKRYLQSALERTDDFHSKTIPVPWKAIFTSIPFLALLVARCAAGWGVNTLQAQIPSYFHGVLKMEITSNALFSALPFVATWALTYVFVIVADILQNKKVMTVTGIRKTFNTIGFWIPTAGLTALGFMTEDNKTLAIVLMTLTMGGNAGGTIGNGLNTIDLSPNHAGTLMGILNTVSNLMPVISPLVVGVIVTDTSNRVQWQIVFAISAVIFFISSLIFIAFGSGMAQPWDAEDFKAAKEASTSDNRTKDVKSDSVILEINARNLSALSNKLD